MISVVQNVQRNQYNYLGENKKGYLAIYSVEMRLKLLKIKRKQEKVALKTHV